MTGDQGLALIDLRDDLAAMRMRCRDYFTQYPESAEVVLTLIESALREVDDLFPEAPLPQPTLRLVQ